MVVEANYANGILKVVENLCNGHEAFAQHGGARVRVSILTLLNSDGYGLNKDVAPVEFGVEMRHLEVLKVRGKARDGSKDRLLGHKANVESIRKRGPVETVEPTKDLRTLRHCDSPAV